MQKGFRQVAGIFRFACNVGMEFFATPPLEQCLCVMSENISKGLGPDTRPGLPCLHSQSCFLRPNRKAAGTLPQIQQQQQHLIEGAGEILKSN